MDEVIYDIIYQNPMIMKNGEQQIHMLCNIECPSELHAKDKAQIVEKMNI